MKVRILSYLINIHISFHTYDFMFVSLLRKDSIIYKILEKTMAFPWTDHAATSSVLERLSKATEVKDRDCLVQLAGGY